MVKQTPLRIWLKRANAWRRVFDQPAIKYPKTFTMCQPIFAEVACEMSPENLTCDGELGRIEIQAKSQDLHDIWAELEGISRKTVSQNETYDWPSC